MYIPRLKQYYKDVIIKTMMDEFGYGNPMSVPKIEKWW